MKKGFIILSGNLIMALSLISSGAWAAAGGPSDLAVVKPVVASCAAFADGDLRAIGGEGKWPRDQRPPALMPFFTFRIMVGLGLLMLGIGLWSLWARWRGTLYDTPWLHRSAVLMGGSGFVAVLAYFERWFGWPTAFFSSFVPLLLAVCAFALWQGLTRDKHLQPFLAALELFILSFAGLGISFYPYMIPGAPTIRDAAAPDSSFRFLLVGAVILVPMILAYTGYAYWVFRGKIDPEEGYH